MKSTSISGSGMARTRSARNMKLPLSTPTQMSRRPVCWRAISCPSASMRWRMVSAEMRISVRPVGVVMAAHSSSGGTARQPGRRGRPAAPPTH